MDKDPKPDPDVLEILSGRYALRSVLGRGSFGTTYLAEDLRLKTTVAVKLVNDSREETADLFRGEVNVAKKLDHPNVVRALDAGQTHDGRLYYVSEWIEGINLDGVLDRTGTLGTTRSLAVAIAVAEALRYVHGLGILHRDLKPSNILIPGWPSDPDFEHPKILDFGVAGRLDHGETRAGMVFGTPRYMSPEQITGGPQTPATDVYGLGLVLFEMLTGKPPLSRITDPFSLFKAILDGIPDQEMEGIPADLANLIRRCTDREAAQRPSIQIVLSELRKASLRQTLFPRAPASPGSLNPPAGEFTKRFGASAESAISAESVPPAAPALPGAPKRPTATLPSAATIPPSPPVRPPRPAKSVDAPRKARKWPLPATVGLALMVAAVSFSIWRFSYTSTPPGQITNPAEPADSGSTPNSAPQSESRLAVFEFALGIVVMAGSIAAGFWLRGWLGNKSHVKTQAFDLMFGARARVDLTATIALQLDELVGKLRALDERILAGTVALMLDEYGRATDAKDRQAALMNVVTLSEKLALRLSPWYERHKEVIASAVAVLGGVSGLVTAINSVVGLHHH
jgi:serine/threonine-protein kinase